MHLAPMSFRSLHDRPLRVVTLNVHSGVPGNLELGDANEDARTIADVGRYLRSIDVDVVMLQEVDDDVARPGKGGVTGQLARYVAAIGADGAAYAPALSHPSGDRFGNAILTRNGYAIEESWNVDLPNPKMPQDRSAAIARVRTPSGAELTVVNAHLAHRPERESDRTEQLRYLGELLATLRRTGGFDYEDSATGQRGSAAGLTGAVLVGGDFNTKASTTDPVMARARLSRIASGAAAPGVHGGIDHIFGSAGLQAVTSYSQLVPRHQLPSGTVTDHPVVVADVRLRASA